MQALALAPAGQLEPELALAQLAPVQALALVAQLEPELVLELVQPPVLPPEEPP